jgi:hypothetical protein
MRPGLASTSLSWSLWNTRYRSCSAATWAVDLNCGGGKGTRCHSRL